MTRHPSIRVALAATVLALLAFGAAAQDAPSGGTLAPSAEELAAGGWHVALPETFRGVFFNPAALVSFSPTFQMAGLSFDIAGPVFAIARATASGGGDMAALMSVLFDPLGRLYAGIGLGGPVMFGWAGDGFGVALSDDLALAIDVASAVDVSIDVRGSLLMQAGYAFAIPLGGSSSIDIGFVAKGFVTGSVEVATTLLEFNTTLMSVMGAPDSLLSAHPFELGIGVGLDAGLRLRLGRGFALAVVARDLLSPWVSNAYTSANDFLDSGATALTATASGLLPIKLAVGLAFRSRFGELERFINDFRISVDCLDVLAFAKPFSRNWLLELSAGVELTMLDVLTLRAGISEALLSAGFTVEFSFMRLSLALYGRELGPEPGSRPVFDLALLLDFAL